MENNERGSFGEDSQMNQNQEGNQNSGQGGSNEWDNNDPNQRSLESDDQSDDFTGGTDEFDDAGNMSTGDYTGSESSSILGSDDYDTDESRFSSDDMDMEDQSFTNDSGQSQATNSDENEDFLGSDWNSRNQ